MAGSNGGSPNLPRPRVTRPFEKGRDLVQRIIPSALNMQAPIIGNLSAADVTTLTRLLRLNTDNLCADSEPDFDEPEELANNKAGRSDAPAMAKVLEIELPKAGRNPERRSPGAKAPAADVAAKRLRRTLPARA